MRKTRRQPDNDVLWRHVLAIGVWALALILLLGIFRHDSGWLTNNFLYVLRVIAGSGAIALPIALGIFGWVLLVGVDHPATKNQYIGIGFFFLTAVIFCQLLKTSDLHAAYANLEFDPDMFTNELKAGGGVIGFWFGYLLESAFGRAGSFILVVAMGFASMLLITRIPATVLVGGIVNAIRPLLSIRPKVRINAEKRIKSESLRVPEEKPKKASGLIEALRLKHDSAIQEAVTDIPVKAPVVIRNGNVNVGDKPPAPVARPTAPKDDSDFHLPPVTLLNDPVPPPKREQNELNFKINKIEQTLEDFKIDADVVEVSHGPTITRYEIQLAPGIKVNKIVSLADNLAMSLAAIDVRVEAPIPGKSAIGVEVPNDNPAIVGLREVIETEQFWNAKTKVTFALGKDVAGQPKFADLTKMPHMLIAGSTNSGKSICLNTLIASLLFRATPRELKLILIDPKRVELSLFDGIPHLCCPVVKDVRQAAGILRTVLKEMDKRYDKFVTVGSRNFEGYNQKVKPEERLPYMVVIIDELADLMMQAGPDVEFCICRLAQLARATGIHLVIATQRPSVDVVTGLIKANISSRIAFAVSSQIDSRTIMDMGGAERLIGRGDMLFKPIDVSKPTRIQGCFVTEKEIDDLVTYLKEQESPDYTMEASQIGEGPSGGSGSSSDAQTDEHYEPAVRLVVGTGYASTSMIQRRFKIGYTRAARLVDAMQEHGLVGPPDGAKPREILIGKGDLDRIFGNTLYGGPADEERAAENEYYEDTEDREEE